MSSPERSRLTMKAWSKTVGVAGAVLGFAALFAAAYYPGRRFAVAGLCLAAAAALLYFVAVERHLLRRAVVSRTARYGANTAAVTLAFLGILVIVNLLASRHNKKWDLTAARIHTLSDQSRKVLHSLTEPITVTAFYPDGSDSRERARRLFENYRVETSHLDLTFVDPDKSPELARQLGIRDYGTTVFSRGEQTFRINQASEEAVTNAIVRVTRRGRKSIYFLSGHGEHSLDDTQRTGYSSAKKALEDQGFVPKELLLLREGAVPKDCEVLVIAGPTKPLTAQEAEVITGYAEDGGKVLLLVDPLNNVGLDEFLASWGVLLHDDVVIDPMSRLFGGSYTTPILTEYPSHEITRDFRVATFLPLARSLQAAQPLPPGVSFAPIARTSPQAWGETNLKDDRAEFDEGADRKGPLTIAGLSQKTGLAGSGKGPAQLLVIGDSDFADNTYFNFSGNGDLFQNAVSFLAKEQDLISIRPKDTRPSPLTLTRSQGAVLFYATVVVAPLITILAGLTIWWKRKNL